MKTMRELFNILNQFEGVDRSGTRDRVSLAARVLSGFELHVRWSQGLRRVG